MLRRQFATMRAHEGYTRLGEDPEELHAGHRKPEASIQNDVCDRCSRRAQPARSRRHPGVVVGLERLSQAGKGQDLEGIREGHREEATLRCEGRKEKG